MINYLCILAKIFLFISIQQNKNDQNKKVMPLYDDKKNIISCPSTLQERLTSCLHKLANKYQACQLIVQKVEGNYKIADTLL